MGLSRAEDILESKIAGTAYDKPPLSRIEALLIQLDVGGGGGGGDHIKRVFVDELPTENIDVNTIYYTPAKTPGDEDKYAEYMYTNGKWERFGVTPDGTGIDYDKLDGKPVDIDKGYIDSLFD